jgi:hypothetical protein
MKKQILILTLALMSACNKFSYKTETSTTDTLATVETIQEETLYTEEECWKLFDEFWVEFQDAVVKGDTVRLKGMCEFEDEDEDVAKLRLDWFLKVLVFDSKFKKRIKGMNKGNRYRYHKYNHNDYYDASNLRRDGFGEYTSPNRVIIAFMEWYHPELKTYRAFNAWFDIIDGEYKFTAYYY